MCTSEDNEFYLRIFFFSSLISLGEKTFLIVLLEILPHFPSYVLIMSYTELFYDVLFMYVFFLFLYNVLYVFIIVFSFFKVVVVLL